MEIVDFQPHLAPAFKTLNEAWIARYFAVEAKDREVLDNPNAIIAGGGFVIFALDCGKTIGCCALMPMDDGSFEVGKMAVHEAHQGRGAGRALMAACIERARARGAPRLYLQSALVLAPALALYRRFGFKDVAEDRGPPSPYARVEVWMELLL
jgi:putative acetyltransferase